MLECEHFIDCVFDDKLIRSDGIDGLRGVQVLEALLLLEKAVAKIPYDDFKSS